MIIFIIHYLSQFVENKNKESIGVRRLLYSNNWKIKNINML